MPKETTRKAQVYEVAKRIFLGDPKRIPDFKVVEDGIQPVNFAEGAMIVAEEFAQEVERAGVAPWPVGLPQPEPAPEGVSMLLMCGGCNTETRISRPYGGPSLRFQLTCGCGSSVASQMSGTR